MNKQLIFIYNAGSDVASAVRDSIKKVKTGKSQCSLCTATWNAFNVKPSWTEKEKRIKIPFTYYHKNDMPKELEGFLKKEKVKLPTVLIKENGEFSELISKDHLDKCDGNDDCVWKLLTTISPKVF